MHPSAWFPTIPEGVQSRAVCAENRDGACGGGGKAGGGRKGAPCIPRIENGQTIALLDVGGCGVIRHIWMTVPDRSPEALRNLMLRMYWDGAAAPSVEAPLGDFFGCAHGRAAPLSSALATMTLGRGFNAYYAMPFRRGARVTITNDLSDGKPVEFLFFQIDYELRDSLPPDAGYFHAEFRRQNPTRQGQDYELLHVHHGPGMFLGCVVGVRPLGPDWWGEGEFKFYIDEDGEHPTICGTGTEDYFGGAWGLEAYQTPWHGCPLLETTAAFPHGLVSLYRWHERDPVYFRRRLRVTVQQLGYREGSGLFERCDDWCSTAFWYLRQPAAAARSPDRAARTTDIAGS